MRKRVLAGRMGGCRVLVLMLRHSFMEQDICIAVTQPYKAKYLAPIEFEAGDALQVLRADDEFPGWFWCSAQSGLKGWVHHSFLEVSSGMTIAVAAYSARELTVRSGEQGQLHQRLDGWGWVSLHDGRSGWIPESCIAEIDFAGREVT